MKKLFVCGFLACITLVFFLSSVPSATAASEEDEVLQVITNFVKGINDQNAELISSQFYHSPKTTNFSIWGRFLSHGWVESPPPGVSFVLSHPEATMLGKEAAVITGYFTVSSMPAMPDAGGAPEASAPPEMSGAPEGSGGNPMMSAEYVRVTLVVQKIGGKWLIVHEHDSYQP